MKFFLDNSAIAQETLFEHGYKWMYSGAVYKYLEQPYLCFVTDNEKAQGKELGHSADRVYLVEQGFKFIDVKQVESVMIKAIKDKSIFSKIPAGITMVKFNGDIYELKTVTEEKWVKQ